MWTEIGTYNVYIAVEDEHGVSLYEQGLPRNRIVVSVTDDLLIDQYMTDVHQSINFPGGLCNKNIWLAQEFTPTKSILSNIYLEVASLSNDTSMMISIRDNLSGDDLIRTSVKCPRVPFFMDPLIGVKWIKWSLVDFQDFEVIPGKSYYIICHCDRIDNNGGVWCYSKNLYDDSYEYGKAYISLNSGDTWKILSEINDFCFITYGMN